ncbi:hypothetical protein WJX74_001895 [Apatococcus lobatus]|uniref:Uncharacterized protein n=1 Tax=Apatococcus lobatus TaxID=904363 RepID=A0AAW1RYA5_9CHLO
MCAQLSGCSCSHAQPCARFENLRGYCKSKTWRIVSSPRLDVMTRCLPCSQLYGAQAILKVLCCRMSSAGIDFSTAWRVIALQSHLFGQRHAGCLLDVNLMGRQVTQ